MFRFRQDGLRVAIEELGLKADKVGAPHPTVSFQEYPLLPSGNPSKYVKAVITLPLIKLDGWRLIAKLDFATGLPIVSTVPGETYGQEPDRAHCDHCGVRRDRNTVYCVQHDNGSRKQVGSTCIADFLGHSTHNLFWLASTAVYEVIGTSDDDFDERWGIRGDETLESYLYWVAVLIRLNGYRSGRKVAIDPNGGDSTAWNAWSLLVSDDAHKEFKKNTPAYTDKISDAARKTVEDTMEYCRAIEVPEVLYQLSYPGDWKDSKQWVG